jgi:hypothetical protein
MVIVSHSMSMLQTTIVRFRLVPTTGSTLQTRLRGPSPFRTIRAHRHRNRPPLCSVMMQGLGSHKQVINVAEILHVVTKSLPERPEP